MKNNSNLSAQITLAAFQEASKIYYSSRGIILPYVYADFSAPQIKFIPAPLPTP